jgi:hypothetical protein
VKANPEPAMLRAVHAGGVTHFDPTSTVWPTGARERRGRLRVLRWQRKLWCKSRLGYLRIACGFS